MVESSSRRTRPRLAKSAALPASPGTFRRPVRTNGWNQERVAQAQAAQPPEASLELRGPLGPMVLTPTPSAQAVGGPAGIADQKANPTDLLASSTFPERCPPARAGREGRRALWASRPWPLALACPQLAKGTSGLRMSAQRRGQFISVLLLFDVHTLALFTTK